MFQDSFAANLVVFLLGQAAAWGYLRTGLVRRGVVVLVASWVLADAALVARFAYGHGEAYLASLLAMQVCCVGGFLLFAHGRLRRRMPGRAARRERRLREAFLAYLRDDLDGAGQLYAGLVRADPWDLPARLGLATVLARRGRRRQARRWLRSVRGLDRNGRYADVVRDELARSSSSRT